MNKFIAAFDGLKYSEVNSSYAIDFAKSTKSHLTGVFLDDKTYTGYKIYDLVYDQGISQQKLSEFKASDSFKRQKVANDFEMTCKNSALEFNIHHDKNVALQELIHETIFADLVIINNKETFSHHEENYPSRFLRDLLSSTQCPVLLTPSEFFKIEKIVFLYDGLPASVYAIKMFTYLLPFLNHLPVEVLSIKSIEETAHLPENKLMKELMKRHYNNISFKIIKGIPEVEIIRYLKNENKKIITVLGAYRRTMLSRWFKSSLADAIMKNFELPLFIAHNK
jgi:nucleotide-binding universal stress UspA family protein